jgi:hypothetical protein
MNVFFGQIYIQPGVSFSFTHHFQKYLSREISALISPSDYFIEKYGLDAKLVFNISAKRLLTDSEIKGPTVFKKSKTVEYTLFLPFDIISGTQSLVETAVRYIFMGVFSVLASLQIDASGIADRQVDLITDICKDRTMFV